jgi:hypothetical protein
MALKGVFLFLFVFVGFFELVCFVNMMKSPLSIYTSHPSVGFGLYGRINRAFYLFIII